MSQTENMTAEEIRDAAKAATNFLKAQRHYIEHLMEGISNTLNSVPRLTPPGVVPALEAMEHRYSQVLEMITHAEHINEEFRKTADKRAEDTSATEDSIDDVIAGVTEELKSRMVGMEPGDRLVLVVGLPEEAPKSPADSLEEMLKQVFNNKLH